MSDLAGEELIRQAMQETREHGQAKCVMTRDGRAVRVYAVDGEVHGAWGIGATCTVESWALNGSLMCDKECGLDLIPSKRSGLLWVNVCADEKSFSFRTREAADICAASDRIACVPVDWTEGDGL